MPTRGGLQQLAGGAVEPFYEGRQLARGYLVELPTRLQSAVEPRVMQPPVTVGGQTVGRDTLAVQEFSESETHGLSRLLPASTVDNGYAGLHIVGG